MDAILLLAPPKKDLRLEPREKTVRLRHSHIDADIAYYNFACNFACVAPAFRHDASRVAQIGPTIDPLYNLIEIVSSNQPGHGAKSLFFGNVHIRVDVSSMIVGPMKKPLDNSGPRIRPSCTIVAPCAKPRSTHAATLSRPNAVQYGPRSVD